MYIGEFKIGDKIRRKNWVRKDAHIILSYDIELSYTDLDMYDLLANDWILYKPKVKREGWINIFKDGTCSPFIWSSKEVALLEYNCPVDCIRIEWEEEE